ncbi:MAG: 50S ribosomal protein L16 [Dehalococcoidia bacterium]|nr:50S ribosomal protein L16 [Dehalococcoidia bacterium]
MLQPKRVKYRKSQRGRRKGVATRGAVLNFGQYGLKAMEPAWLTARQIEAGRRVIVRYLRRGGQMWVRVFPDKPISKKPLETRMGGGKAGTEEWVAVIKPGRILFEISGIQPTMAQQALRQAAGKLPFPTRIVGRADYLQEPEAVEGLTKE